jgi:hypothetical protein
MNGSELLNALRTASVRKVSIGGLDLHIRGLTGAERRLLQQRAKDGDPLMPHELVGLAVCDETGAAILTAEQVAELANVDGHLTERICEAVLKASGLLPKAQDEAAKN